MTIYRHKLHFIVAAMLFISSPVSAKELSDEEAYSRAHTMCSQKVYPLWRPKEGETVNKDNYARTPPRLKKIAACMRDKGVPAAYSDETQSVVRTGSGFGHNVDIKIEDLFPDDIWKPRENPHKKQQILPDPDYTRAEDAPAPPDAEDIRMGLAPDNYKASDGAADNNGSDASQSSRTKQPPSGSRLPVRPGDIGVITGSGNNSNSGGDNGEPKPIFLPR